MAARGRRPLLTDPDLRASLLAEIGNGATYADAATLVGITPDVLSLWLRKGREKPRSIYGQFVRDLSEARAKRRKTYRALILKQGNDRKDWRATAFIASVTEREHFAQRVHVVVEEQLQGAIDRLMKEFSSEAEHAILERALAAIAGEDGIRAPGGAASDSGTRGDEGSRITGAASAVIASSGVLEPDV
jgi:hypothetical protein